MGEFNKKSLKILWVSLVKFPPLSEYLGETAPAHCGWLYSSAKALMEVMPEVRLGVLVYSDSKKYEKIQTGDITYYLIPSAKIDKISSKQISSCRKALTDFEPELIHIHGTEHSLAKAVCLANGGIIKSVANIQGLAGPITRYADGGLSTLDKLTNITPLDFFRGTFLLSIKKHFRHRGEVEKYVISHLTDIIGRTQWDHDHAVTLNPAIRYHFLNETLRDSFYESPAWNYKKCRKHSIFVSNSGSPLKGAHQVLKALPIILRNFPDTVVNFCGSSVMNNDLKSRLHFQGYHIYLRRLVKKLRLQKHVQFLGTLNEQQMKQAFLEANVYVMPSAIENSPNSLCEAQILGVPTIASYCGGTPTLVEDGKSGFLYRYEEFEMLAQTIIRLFTLTDFSELSECERVTAFRRHDKTKNAMDLKTIYQQMING